MVSRILALLILLSAAAHAQEPTFLVSSDAGSFRWRVHGTSQWNTSRSTRERLPMLDSNKQKLSYDIEVDNPAGWWMRHVWRSDGPIVGAEHAGGMELQTHTVVDVGHVAITVAGVAIPLVTAVVVLLRTRRQLKVTHEALSEAEARGGLFPADGSTPSRIDGYDVVRKLGAGGMAVVYHVRRDGVDYALKLPLPTLLDDDDFRARFARELKLGMTLDHPHLVHFYDVNDGRGDFGYPYLVMELVSGESLEDRLARGRLDAPTACRLVRQVLDALEFIHGRSILHRDLKPSNVMITASGNARLMDFGIAWRQETDRLTSTGDVLGTPMYLAPEQVQGKQGFLPSVDIYGAGMILYESLAGRLPWDGNDAMATMMAKVSGEAPALSRHVSVDARLEACVTRMIAREPEARYRSAADARDALNPFA